MTKNPKLPSEQEILSYLENASGKDRKKRVTKREITQYFSLKGSERLLLKRLLKEMIARGQLSVLRKKESVKRGRLEQNQDSESILAIYRQNSPTMGSLISTNKRLQNKIEILVSNANGAQDGELVEAGMKRGQYGKATAHVLRRLGRADAPNQIARIALHQYDIPDKFSQELLTEAEELKNFTLQGRSDLRHLPLVTIDPIDARDHDDAVWAEADCDLANEGGVRLIVAIADVAAYVRSGTGLDQEARRRGNSVYFPGRVVPMLPERISNDLCSLVEGKDRPVLACIMRFDKNGVKITHYFERAIMRSAAKLSYEQAQAAIDGHPDEKTKPLLESALKPLWHGFTLLNANRQARGPLELDLPERKLLLDEEGRVKAVTIPLRLEAHRMIEEFMIQANVAAAESLIAGRSPVLFRIHEQPNRDKLEALAQLLKTIGIDLKFGKDLSPSQFNQILERAEGRSDKFLIHESVLRAQAQALYSPENKGHFGLNLQNYAHFTSPIRRYADLIIHRSLISTLQLGEDGLSKKDITQLSETAQLISAAERRAMVAERETTARLVALYLSAHKNAEFDGRIVGVVGAGLFVALDPWGVDGFVSVSSLSDYFYFDAARHALIGKRSKVIWQLGMRVRVQLLDVAPVSGGLKLRLLSSGGQQEKIPSRRRAHRAALN